MFLKFLVFFLVSLLDRHVNASSRIDPLVDSKVGLIRGLKATDGDYSMFMGIPYAQVDPANPFGLSTPYPPFNEVFEAYDDSAICPQIEEFNNTIVGTIDCLHLNIYVPSSANSRNRLPVFVWIYGGGFSIGFAGRTLHGPKYIVRHDVILVTLNYRLGPYGFMCLNIPEVPGNQGLKDQLIALRWIKDNIESFGGDVNKITVFGESAGGISVDLHLYSPHEKLFRSAILQSGTALMNGLTNLKPIEDSTVLKLAEKLGFVTFDIYQALSFLATVNPTVLIAAASEVNEFLPCIENDYEGIEKFYLDSAYNLDIPKAKGMNILIGFNAEEGHANFFKRTDQFYSEYNEFYEKLKKSFDFEETDLNDMVNIVRHFYIGDENVSDEVKYNLGNFESDYRFNYPALKSASKYVENGAAKVFLYQFSYVGNRNWVKRHNNITEGGAFHADELGYLFDISIWKEEPTSADQIVIDRITTLWTNFVKHGDPTPESTDLLPVKWEPITSEDSPRYFLNIDYDMTLGKRPYSDRMAFWELFYSRNEKFLKGYNRDKK